MRNNGKMDVVLGGNATSMFNAESIDDMVKESAKKYHNESLQKAEALAKKNTDEALAKAKEMREKAQSLDLRPINYYVLCKPYAKNPFEMMEMTKGGIIIPEYDGTFKNPDTGEMDKEVNFSVQAEVLEVSPQCKFVKPGDVVYYRRAAAVPIPFMRQGLEVVAETSIQLIVNDKNLLDERFKNFDA